MGGRLELGAAVRPSPFAFPCPLAFKLAMPFSCLALWLCANLLLISMAEVFLKPSLPLRQLLFFFFPFFQRGRSQDACSFAFSCAQLPHPGLGERKWDDGVLGAEPRFSGMTWFQSNCIEAFTARAFATASSTAYGVFLAFAAVVGQG